jgi:hypothetical protein
MNALKNRWKVLALGLTAAALFLGSVTPAHAESDAHEVMVAVKSLFAIKVALGLYQADHTVYPEGEFTTYKDLKCVLCDRYGIPYMELPSEWEQGEEFEFVSYSGDGESFMLNVRASDLNGTIVSATPDRVIIR